MLGGGRKEWARAAGGVEDQERGWVEFFEAAEFIKLMVLQRGRWSTSFAGPLAFVLSATEVL
jgi:hypothetical protein